MGCAPTNRKREIFPAGQAHPIGLTIYHSMEPQTRVIQVKQTNPLTSIENQMEREGNKQNTAYKGAKAMARTSGSTRPDLEINDITVKDQRRVFVLEKMNFTRR